MTDIKQLLTEHMDIWTAADTEKKSGRGRASGNAGSVYGVKKLRELILELAVRGKLVPQNANDEPASELLKRIQAEKAKLIAEGKLKKDKPLAPIGGDEKPFELPKGWEFARFGEYLDFQGGGQPPKDVFVQQPLDGYVQLIQIRDLGEKPQPVYIPIELASKFCTSEDIMIGRYGASVGKVFWGKDGSYNVALVKIIDDFKVYSKRFLFEFFRSPSGQSFFNGMSRSAQAGFNKGDIESKIVPIPPLAEQHRIVAKVDELMALCNQLEQQHNNAQEAHETLVSQLLATLTQPNKTTPPFNQRGAGGDLDWQRIYAHFDVLFTTEASIDALKQTLLQLAVMGKLVPQDPADAPADEILQQIRKEKVELIEKGVIRKPRSKEEGFIPRPGVVLPDGWVQGCVADFGAAEENAIVDGPFGSNLLLSDYIPDGDYPVISISNIDEGFDLSTLRKISEKKFQELKRSAVRAGDILVAKIGSSYGKVGFYPSHMPVGIIPANLLKITINNLMNRDYFVLLLRTPLFKTELDKIVQITAQPAFGVSKFKLLPVPVPPLHEQHRIVAKVDELMALCDQLKTRIQQASQQQQAIADALVAQAVA